MFHEHWISSIWRSWSVLKHEMAKRGVGGLIAWGGHGLHLHARGDGFNVDGIRCRAFGEVGHVRIAAVTKRMDSIDVFIMIGWDGDVERAEFLCVHDESNINSTIYRYES